ncbi:MAG: fibronectin type III domain-containing protein [Nocardioides sp.]|nr:fibronectin type III domain-containing protein [Nocardioides sp.]
MGSISLDWDAPALNPDAVIDYEVQVKAGDSPWQSVGDGVSTATEAMLTGLDQAQSYRLRVKAVAAGSDSEWQLAGDLAFHGLAVGIDHTCAINTRGEVYCWGSNSQGQLGDGTLTARDVPTKVAGLSGVISLAAGWQNTCASTEVSVYCWGSNYGWMVNPDPAGSPNPYPLPQARPDIPASELMTMGRGIGCALASTGLSCWGGAIGFNNGYAQSRSFGSEPVDVSAGRNHACAVLADKTIQCFGLFVSGNPDFPNRGQLGSGLHEIDSAVAAAAGEFQSCTELETGSVLCWGANESGQLGDGTKTDRSAPAPVTALTSPAQLAIGDKHACALSVSGTVSCWGGNSAGQLGIGGVAESLSPAAVPGLAAVQELDAANERTCVLLDTGVVRCWGAGSVAPADIGGGDVVRTAQPPSAPAAARQTGSTSTSVDLAWDASVPDASPVTGYTVQRLVNGGWTTAATTAAGATAVTLSNLGGASSYAVRVVAGSAAGDSVASNVVNATTSGTRTTRLTVVSGGQPVTGGAVSWRTVDGRFASSQAFGLTQLGVVDLLRTPAGPGVVTLNGGRVPGGDSVTGAWSVQLGESVSIGAVVPAPPSQSARTIQVRLPNGVPVPDARVSVAGLSASATVAGFSFSAASPSFSGATDDNGRFVARGYGSGPLSASVTYDDGVLVQNVRNVPVNSGTTVVTLEEMPYLEVDAASFTANQDDAVSIPIEVAGSSRLAARGPQGARAKVTIVPPKGASQKVCRAKLSGKTNRQGRLTLTVCASKSGLYEIRSSGAVTTSSVLLKVRRGAPMPVTSASGASPAPGTAKVAWNAPIYSGGVKVKEYVVTLRLGSKKITRTVKSRSASFKRLRNASTYSATIVAVTKYGKSDPVKVEVPVA